MTIPTIEGSSASSATQAAGGGQTQASHPSDFSKICSTAKNLAKQALGSGPKARAFQVVTAGALAYALPTHGAAIGKGFAIAGLAVASAGAALSTLLGIPAALNLVLGLRTAIKGQSALRDFYKNNEHNIGEHTFKTVKAASKNGTLNGLKLDQHQNAKYKALRQMEAALKQKRNVGLKQALVGGGSLAASVVLGSFSLGVGAFVANGLLAGVNAVYGVSAHYDKLSLNKHIERVKAAAEAAQAAADAAEGSATEGSVASGGIDDVANIRDLYSFTQSERNLPHIADVD